jgi:Zn-dependent M28 family amino/carboxypeptidase
MNHTTAVACVLTVLTPFAFAQTRRQAPVDPKIDASRVAEHVKTIASDEYEGRAPGTKGETKTVDYLIRQVTALGLKPGGDPDGNGGRRWTQDVPLTQADADGPVTALLKTRGQTRLLQQSEDIALRATFHRVSEVAVKDAPLVFVGYGVKAPERNWDDFKGVDLKGKIGLVLINDPDFEADLGGRFDGKAMTYYGRWSYKYEEAARQGALGMIVIHETAPASYGWATVKNSNAVTMFDIRRENPARNAPLVSGWIQRPVVVDLFRSVGLDFEAEKRKAQSADFRPVPLGEATLSVAYKVKQTGVISHNVLGILPGTRHPEEIVMYTAHWDHLGVGLPDAKGDRIYNGARDNALGTAGLLEIARAYAAQPRTERSVAFMWLTAEEKGLLGSEYYAQRPLYPLALTAGVINSDGGRIWGLSKDVAVAGEGKVTLQDDLSAAAQRQGRTLSPDPSPERGSFFRSDHFSFAKVGVPAISFRVGFNLANGGVASGKELNDEYNAKQYHQPSDEYSDKWDLSGMIIDQQLLYRVGRDLANSRRWPAWKEGSEFKAIREKTASERKP